MMEKFVKEGLLEKLKRELTFLGHDPLGEKLESIEVFYLNKYGDRFAYRDSMFRHNIDLVVKSSESCDDKDSAAACALAALIVATDMFDPNSHQSFRSYAKVMIDTYMPLRMKVKDVDFRCALAIESEIKKNTHTKAWFARVEELVDSNSREVADAILKNARSILTAATEISTVIGDLRRIKKDEPRVALTDDLVKSVEDEYVFDDEFERSVELLLSEFDDMTRSLVKSMGQSGCGADFTPMRMAYELFVRGCGDEDAANRLGTPVKLYQFTVASACQYVRRFRAATTKTLVSRIKCLHETAEEFDSDNPDSYDEYVSCGATENVVKILDDDNTTSWIVAGSAKQAANIAEVFKSRSTKLNPEYLCFGRSTSESRSIGSVYNRIAVIAGLKKMKKKDVGKWHFAPFYGGFYSEFTRYGRSPEELRKSDVVGNVIASHIDMYHPYNTKKSD